MAKKEETPGSGKAPRAFKKGIGKDDWQKKWLRYIELPYDREFFSSGFEEKNGKMELKAGFGPKDLKKLKKLSKEIKANRAVFKAGPIFAIGILLGGIALFGLVFMNPLLEKGIEAALSSVFDAACEVKGLHFYPFAMSLKMDSLAVADRDAPMSNLFETKKLALAIDPSALFRGRVYIKEALADSIQAGTARTTSGALPEKAPKEKKARKALIDSSAFIDFQNFDAMALLEQESSRLASKLAYEKAGIFYDELSAKWDKRLASSGKVIEELESQSRELLGMNPKNIKSPAEGIAAINSIKNGINTGKTAAEEIKAISKGLDEDIREADGLLKEARAAVNKDIDYLVSFIDPRSGTAMAALEPQIRAMLSDKGERYLYYGSRAWEVLSALSEKQKEKAKAEKKSKKPYSYKGRDMYFPGSDYPAFRLGLMRSSFTLAGVNYGLQLKEISSEPKLLAEPASMKFELSSGTVKAGLDAVLDLRQKASWSASVSGEGIPLDFGSGLAAAGISGLKGSIGGMAYAQGSDNENFSLGIDVELDKPELGDATGSFGTAFRTAVARAGAIMAKISYKAESNADTDFSIKTNLDEIMSSVLAEMAKDYLGKAKTEIAKTMQSYVSAELEGRLSPNAVNDFLALAKKDEAAVDKLNTMLNNKTAEIEARVKELGGNVLKDLGVPGLPSFGRP